VVSHDLAVDARRYDGGRQASSEWGVFGRVWIAVVDVVGSTTPTADGAHGNALVDAIAVNAPDGVDGTLQEIYDGERAAWIEGWQMDLGVTTASVGNGLHSVSRSRQCG
jgi:hypothetical protein